jgi:hypothetical protein
MAARVSLDDKYALDRGCVFISGTQALVRLPLMQLDATMRQDPPALSETVGEI